MYNFVVYLKLIEVARNEHQDGFYETGKSSFCVNTISIPFIPTIGMLIRLHENGIEYPITDLIWSCEFDTLEVYFENMYEPREDYEDRLESLLKDENWELISSTEETVSNEFKDVGNN